MTSFFPRLSESSAGKQTGRPHRQGALACFQGCGCPSPYERPRKSCSPHKESMFWNLKDFAATRIQGARATPSRRSRLSQGWPVTEGEMPSFSRGRGLTLERVGSHAGWLRGVVPALSLLCHTGRESQRTIAFLHCGSQLSLNYSNALDQLFRTMNWHVQCAGFARKQEA